MRSLGDLFGRAHRSASLRVKGGDAFEACAGRLGITAREAEIVRLLLEGKDSRGIGEALFISDHTVKNHIHHIYQKLGVGNRVQLVRCFQSALEEPGLPPQGAAARGAASRLRRTVLPAAALLLVLAAAFVAWKPWGLRPRPAAFPPPPALAVLDFENLSGDAEIDKWQTGLPLILATVLSQSKHIRTLGDDAVYGALSKFDLTGRARYTREELRRLAKEMKADYLVSGTLMMAGGAIVVTANLQDARTGEAVQTEKLECQGDQDLMRKADGLAQIIRARLTRAAAKGQDDIDLDIEVLTTSSALAYKYYAEGWRYHRTGEYEQSLLMLMKAVEIDPEFAMAYRMMSVDARNLRYDDREDLYIRKAFELAARLPENARERHLIRADFYSGTEATWELSVAEYKKILEDHPYDVTANNNLAILYFDLEDFESAIRYASVPVREGTANPFPHYTKAISLWGLGRFEEALRVFSDYHETYAASRLLYQTLISMLLMSGDFAGTTAALDKAASVFPDPSWAYWRGALLFNSRGEGPAREEFRKLFLLDEAPWRLEGHMRLAMLDLAEGRFAEAEKECRDAIELAESIRESQLAVDFRLMRGQILIEQGRIPDALVEIRTALDSAPADGPRLRAALQALGRASALAGDLATLDDTTRRFRTIAASATTRQQARDFDYYLGIVAFERGRAREAVEALEKAVAQLPGGWPPARRGPLMFLYLGLAREKAGDPAGAAEAFGAIIGAVKDRLDFGDILPLALLGRARVEESLGRPAAALEDYRSFLGLWAGADPGRPEVDEARARVSALSGSPGQAR